MKAGMADSALYFDAEGLTALMRRLFPNTDSRDIGRVGELKLNFLRMTLPFRQSMLRPGDLISGPTLMSLADSAAYALVLAHIGEKPMAVTSSLIVHFLRQATAGDLNADATMLRLGRRNAVIDVGLWTEDPDQLVAHATVTYVLPHEQI